MFDKCTSPDYGEEPAIRSIGSSILDLLAERAGFEPAVGLTLRTLSRRVT